MYLYVDGNILCLSHLKASLAIVTVHEICHGFVSAIDLKLDEPCLVALAVLARKEALVTITLGFDFLSGPICPFVTQVFATDLLPLFLQLVACKEPNVHIKELFWSHSFR